MIAAKSSFPAAKCLADRVLFPGIYTCGGKLVTMTHGQNLETKAGPMTMFCRTFADQRIALPGKPTIMALAGLNMFLIFTNIIHCVNCSSVE